MTVVADRERNDESQNSEVRSSVLDVLSLN